MNVINTRTPIAPAQIVDALNELHAADNSLNAVLIQAQSAFTALDLGVSASVEFYPHESGDPFPVRLHVLDFDKCKGAWCFMVCSRTGEVGTEDEWSSVPLLSAGRATRIAAADRLPVLLAQLLTRSSHQTSALRHAASCVYAFLAGLDVAYPPASSPA